MLMVETTCMSWAVICERWWTSSGVFSALTEQGRNSPALAAWYSSATGPVNLFGLGMNP